MTNTVSGISDIVSRTVNAELALRGLDQKDLIPVLGLSKNTVYARTNGSRPFTITDLEKIAAFFGMTDEIFLAKVQENRLALEADPRWTGIEFTKAIVM